MPASSNLCFGCGREGRGSDIHIGTWSFHLFEDYNTAELREVGIKDFTNVIDEDNLCLFCWEEQCSKEERESVVATAAWADLASEHEEWNAAKTKATWSPTKQESKKGIIRSGWLEKRGAVNTAFQKRFFRLTPSKLEYFKAESGSVRGFITIPGSTVKFSSEDEKTGTLLITSPSQRREFVLRGNTRTILDWKEALMKAIAVTAS